MDKKYDPNKYELRLFGKKIEPSTFVDGKDIVIITKPVDCVVLDDGTVIIL